MFSLNSPRKVRFACPTSSSLNLCFFICGVPHASALIPPPCCRGAALAYFDSLLPLDLVIWTDRFVPFPFSKGGTGVHANCSLCVALRQLFPFQKVQFVKVFPLKPTPFCKCSAGLGSINKSTTLLLFSSSRSVIVTSSVFLLSPSLWQELSSLSSCSIR